MATTTFTSGTVVASDWLNDVDDETYGVFSAMTATEIADVEARTFLVDVGDAVRTAVATALSLGKKKIYFPAGGYLIGSTTSSDTLGNGILLPFTTVNPNPALGLLVYGEGGGTELRCGDDDMILIRCSRNNVVIKDMYLNGNSRSNVWGVGIVPESMTQTTTQVSQQFIDLYNVDRIGFTEGLVFQPGPQVGGGDSGCFYMNVYGGYSNNNTRHIYSKKNADWASHPNRLTRTNFFGQHLLRGNVGYYFEVGTEIELHGCYEELIATGSSPCATPTARYVSADCSSITFFGGYSEACTRPVDILAKSTHGSYQYSAGTAFPTNWYTNIEIFGDKLSPSTWTPVVTATSGTAGTNSSTGYAYRVGHMVHFVARVNCAVGTLSGNISITGLRDVAMDNIGSQYVPVSLWDNINFTGTDYVQLGAIISEGSATMSLYKSSNNSGGAVAVTIAELTSTDLVVNIQGSYFA